MCCVMKNQKKTFLTTPTPHYRLNPDDTPPFIINSILKTLPFIINLILTTLTTHYKLNSDDTFTI